MIFLRLLEEGGAGAKGRRGRRMRDGRTPFVPQQELAAWFKMPQPDISRVEVYWLGEDWPNLLSLKAPEVLTYELRGRIVASLCAGLSIIWPTEVAQNHVPSL